MAELVVVVPSRGRPHAVAPIVAALKETCTASTLLTFAVDADDPTLPLYSSAAVKHNITIGVADQGEGMVATLNQAVGCFAKDHRGAIAFLGDDHRPRTVGWDTAYLEALRAKPGMVYGNDLIQGARLPTQIAMSASVVRALGHMAPPVLRHLYVDNYWLALGHAADCITYLPHIIVEHMHPVAGKAPMDEGYVRVNAPDMYAHDSVALADYLRENLAREAEAVRAAVSETAVA